MCTKITPDGWLQIDLERLVTATRTKLTFPTEGNWRYKIEISDDGETNWKLIADQTQTADAIKERSDVARAASLGDVFSV